MNIQWRLHYACKSHNVWIFLKKFRCNFRWLHYHRVLYVESFDFGFLEILKKSRKSMNCLHQDFLRFIQITSACCFALSTLKCGKWKCYEICSEMRIDKKLCEVFICIPLLLYVAPILMRMFKKCSSGHFGSSFLQYMCGDGKMGCIRHLILAMVIPLHSNIVQYITGSTSNLF